MKNWIKRLFKGKEKESRIFYVNAVDSKSFAEYLKEHSEEIVKIIHDDSRRNGPTRGMR